MLIGPFTGQGRCTFCGTSDVLCHPSPREELVRLGFDLSVCQTAETHPCACPECCGRQEDGHDFSYERGEGWRCERCSDEPPLDWFNDDFE